MQHKHSAVLHRWSESFLHFALVEVPVLRRTTSCYAAPGIPSRLPYIGRMNAALTDRDRFTRAAQPPRHEFVERGEIGFPPSNERIRIGALGGDRAAIFRQTH